MQEVFEQHHINVNISDIATNDSPFKSAEKNILGKRQKVFFSEEKMRPFKIAKTEDLIKVQNSQLERTQHIMKLKLFLFDLSRDFHDAKVQMPTNKFLEYFYDRM